MLCVRAVYSSPPCRIDRSQGADAEPVRREVSEGVPSTESSSAWPLRVMALVLAMLGLVPMAIFLTEDQGVAWWNADGADRRSVKSKAE